LVNEIVPVRLTAINEDGLMQIEEIDLMVSH
jgi:hypothetical protein